MDGERGRMGRSDARCEEPGQMRLTPLLPQPTTDSTIADAAHPRVIYDEKNWLQPGKEGFARVFG